MTGVAVVVFTAAALLPELFTDRYEALAIGTSLPAAPILTVAARNIDKIAFAIAAILLFRHLHNWLNQSNRYGPQSQSLQKNV